MKVMFCYEKEIFKFSQLEKKVQDKVMSRYKQQDSDLRADELAGLFSDKLIECGLGYLNAYWRLSCCQGDGVAFESSQRKLIPSDFEKVLSFLFPYSKIKQTRLYHWWINGIFTFHVIHRGNYHHKNSIDVVTEFLYDSVRFKNVNALIAKFEEELGEYLRALSSDFETEGYKFFESFNAEHYSAECDNAEIAFDSLGNEVNVESVANGNLVWKELFKKEDEK